MNTLEKVKINGSDQWLLVRSKNPDAPLILHVQAGPGMPMISEANKMRRLFDLENNFTIAYWDQRACGKSFDKHIDPSTINFSQLTDDLIACTGYLRQKYNKDKIILIGYSLGATISLMAISKNSELFSHSFLVSPDIDIRQAGKYAIEFAMEKAEEKNSPKLLKQAKALQGVEILTDKLFQQRAKLLSDLGGMMAGSTYRDILMSTVRNMLSSKACKLSDIPGTIKGMSFCQNALLAELNTLNLFEEVKQVDCPVHFLHGKQNGISPYHVAVDYFNYIESPNKTFTTFEDSAHLLHYEDPEGFVSVIRKNTHK